ncbi:MAG: S8 family serine peptidase [Chloroflexota bacterium]|nr:S8 family serine peptidase [Chloroflexota bacterium]
MNTIYRTIGIILVFFLLTSAGVSALTSPLADKSGEESLQSQSPTPNLQTLNPKIRNSSEPPIEPELARALLEAESNENRFVRVILHLREQADLEAVTSEKLRVTEARFRVVSALQASAARSQAPLLVYLEGARASGLVESYTPFWVFNGIAVRARPSVVRDLVVHPAVATVRLDHYRQWVLNSNPQSPIPNPQSQIEWGVARVRADQVWISLHISGTGTVVAGMDTGVDWLHPTLRANYRGYNPHGPSNHTYSWRDSTDGGALYPVDDYGHGSHTLGSAVGQDGIGVAPGAQWIAVKVLDNRGSGYDSWIHDGFQWLLAPGGDPAQAPDVVNCSWGSSISSLTTFQSDLQALRGAGIFVVFSNGNRGPDEGTVSSPASLPGTFAIGATDSDDEVANFSSRGPSPWGETRPHVVAPGVDVYSSLPGGTYGLMNGTSMAAPHVSGLVALLHSVSPTLSITRATFIITSTAAPLGDLIPNNDTGWGRVDGFAAAVALAQPGFVTGTVTRASDGVFVTDATVVATPHGDQGGGKATTDGDGRYLLALAPTIYDLTASAFGYEPNVTWGAVVATDTTTVVDFPLTPLPTGTLRGRITDLDTGAPITATVAMLDTPLEATDNTYTYTFILPAGTYTVQASRLGYRVVTATAVVTAGQTAVADLSLPSAPPILLVDSGSWYYGSQTDYFRQALDDVAYTYDEWDIKYLPDDLPTAADLTPYEIVVWSAPQDAPGYIGAQDAVVGYLSAGGRLLLTGQDVGYWDGSGLSGYQGTYYRDYLKTQYVRDNTQLWVLRGIEDDIFAGLTITTTGSGGADNQSFPDEIAVADPDAAASVLVYQGDGCGGVRVGTCLDYRVIYFSFGFEAINNRTARREVMDRSLDWLTAPPPTVGLELNPTSQVGIGLPGSVVTHALRVRHVGQGGITDTVSISLDGASWETHLSDSSLSLAPCTSATLVVTVAVPPLAAWDARDVITLTVGSSLSSTLIQTATITTKAPAPILLVDDERWHNRRAKYEVALANNGFPYDYWRTSTIHAEPPGGSPSLAVLQRYPIIVWFTGYDWAEPVTADERASLMAYLDGAGRLFLSSQDMLYYHHDTPFSRDYLGVAAYTESVTPTLAMGVPENPIGDRLGPYPLDYPFNNWSDSIVPLPGVAVAFRDQERQSIALARQAAGYRTVFFSFPYETLLEAGRVEAMERIVGWLSWLGGSTFTVNQGAATPGDTLTYTLRMQNDGPISVTASLSNTIPTDLVVVPGSFTGPGSYYTLTRRLSWSGPLGSGEAVTFTYRASIVTGTMLGSPVVNTARLGLEDHYIHFHRAAVVGVSTPDLSPSAFQCGPYLARPGTIATCTLTLANAGPGDAPQAVVTNLLPEDTALITGSLAWTDGGTVEIPTGTVRWTGPLSAGGQVTLAYQIALPTDPVHNLLYSVAFLEDNTGGEWERATWLLVEPLRCYLPLVLRNGS